MENYEKNESKKEDQPLSYQAYKAYLNSKMRRLDLNQLLKNALVENQ